MKKVGVVIPLKSFDVAKDRLRRGGTEHVDQLASDLARRVIESCRPRTVIVLSESPDITHFARELGTEVLESSARGLNDSVQHAYGVLGERFDQLVVVHGDLYAPEGLGAFSPEEGVTIVTDHHQRGTNVLALPSGVDFHFSYGPDSKDRHRREARRLGLTYHVVTDSPWALDVDEPGDLLLGQQRIRGGPGAPSNTRPRTD
jgi:2-phospho-L-lactate guanylyltransferase